ncbi:MAG: glutamine synthetase family protein [Eubacteriales bacterium]
MRETNIHETELQRIVEENDLKFIRLATCDLSGETKNVSILPGMLKTAFFRGMPFDGRRIAGFESGGDLYLYPESTGISILPWRPTSGRVARILCDVCRADGTPFEGDSRLILKKAVKAAQAAGFAFTVGTENEFYLFKADENGEDTGIPLDNASYMDIAPADKGENVRREICLTLEEMGITPERSYHEEGPGQNEIVFKAGDPLAAADHFMTYKMVVRTVAAKNGLSACFDPKPMPEYAGSGLRISFTLLSRGINSATPDEVRHFAAGINKRLPEISLFLNSTVQSFDRLTALDGSPAVETDGSEVTVSSADLLLNPYLAFALLITAGIRGIEKEEECGVPDFPKTLEEALELCENSEFVREVLPAETATRYLELCRSRILTYRE